MPLLRRDSLYSFTGYTFLYSWFLPKTKMILSLYVNLHFTRKVYDIYAFVSDFFSQYNDFNIHSYCVIHSFFFISTYYLTIRRHHTVLFIHPLMNIWIIFCLWSPEKKEWLPTPVFLLGKSYGQRSLVEYNPWSHQESDISELTFTFQKTNVNKAIMNIYAKFSV